jgi:cysteine desulfurase
MELYLNYASHHPLAKGVVDKLYNKTPYLYNPSDDSDIAESAKLILRQTRQKLYDMLNTDESKYNIIFTSSGSESNNTVLNGIDYDCLYTTNAEHSSIIERLKSDLRFRENIFIKSDGSTIDYNWLNVNLEDDNASNLQDLVSVQWVNNETGHINNVKKISEIVHNNGHLFHVDAVQAFGKMPIDLSKLDVDFMSISGHKIGAFSGVGVLVAKKDVHIDPLIYGHQEFGMRGGTENIIGIASLDYALDTVDYSQETMEKHEAMNKAICDGLFKRGLDYRINNPGIAEIMSISFKGINGEMLKDILEWKYHIYVSTGSACNTGMKSYVLEAYNVPREYINGTIRVSFDNLTDEEIEYFCDAVKEAVDSIKETTNA